MRQILRLSVVLAGLTLLVSSVTRSASADEPVDPGKALADRCEQLSNQGKYASALEVCERATELSSDPGLWAYIAQIQTALLHPVEAHAALQHYLRSSELSQANRDLAEAQLRHLETLIATLSVTSRIQGAEIRVDGQAMAESALARGVQLVAGAHRLTLQKDGTTFEQFVVLRGGERAQIELPSDGFVALRCAVPEVRFFIDDQEVEASQASSGVSRAAGKHRVTFKAGSTTWPEQPVTVRPDERVSVVCAQPPAASTMKQRGYWVTGTGLALGVAALATGIYNSSQYERWQTANDDLRTNQGKLTFADFQSQAQDNQQLMESIQTRRKVAIGLGIAGGLVTAGGVALLLHDSAASTRQGKSSWPRRIAAGLSVRGAVNSGEIAWQGAW